MCGWVSVCLGHVHTYVHVCVCVCAVKRGMHFSTRFSVCVPVWWEYHKKLL